MRSGKNTLSELAKLKNLNFGGWVTQVNSDLGYAPYFLSEVKSRINRELANNIVITGEAGIGKSYQGFSFSRIISNKFGINDIVSTYAEYMEAIMKTSKQGVPIAFDEPQYALDKRDWYNQLNKALVKTMTSQRFRLRPVIIPIINLSLLDKVLRSYLIQFHVVMNSRGKGYSYRLQPSQFEEKIYRTRICKIDYGLFDVAKCDRPSCLTCSNMQGCKIFRALYEKKKLEWQDTRDTQSMEQAKLKDMPKITDKEMLEAMSKHIEMLKNKKNMIDPQYIIGFIRDKFKVKIGKSRAYELRGLLFYDYPNLAPEIIE